MNINECNNRWNNLTIDAKNVIEWVECPRSGNFNNVEIEIEKEFKPRSDVNVYISKYLFNEIYDFVSNDSNLKILNKTDNTLIFCFIDEYKKKWRGC